MERFPGGVIWYMMETKDVLLSISLKLKNQKGNLVSFNGQSISFNLALKEM